MRKEYNKLVRDNIPEIIKNQGQTLSCRILNDDEYKTELIKKLAEEIDEFRADFSIEEFCDIVEVLSAIAATQGFALDDIRQYREKKNQSNGAFEKRIFLEYVDDLGKVGG